MQDCLETAKLAASVVQLTATAIMDPSKFATSLYNRQAKVAADRDGSRRQRGRRVRRRAQGRDIEGLALSQHRGGLAARRLRGRRAVACMVGAGRADQPGKGRGTGRIHSFGDAFKSRDRRGAGTDGRGAGAIAARSRGGLAGAGSRRVLAGAARAA